MEDKIVLKNPQKFDVGIVTMAKPMGVNIKAGSFCLVNQDELNYIASICTLLQDGILTVDDEHVEAMKEVGIDPKTDPNFISDDEIRKKLGGTAKKLREWLQTVDKGHILDRVYDVAVTMNLSADKLKVLTERMPDKDFLGE